MQRRELTILTAALLCSGTAAAQDAPRTPWGHPDFRGTWTNATLTPLQRAVELGDKEFYTPEEREAFAQARRAATSADRPLAPGEYAFFAPPKPDGSGGAGDRVWDFGVDGK